ncbi:hypothetical protein GGR54DRAFT_603984 [Hypoxylon sp. NC1633]|nr:hypothetical protein GGR54DRAFT_603984 [Hypoxylon sp. NC1633]
MTAPGCNHARQSGWLDSAVIKYLSFLVMPCEKSNPSRPFCSKLAIDASLDDPAQSSSSYATTTSLHNALSGKCKFCSTYDSDVGRAEHIKQTLTQYNMALLFDEAKMEVGAEMEAAFQKAVDEAVLAYGPDGKKGDKALRVLDAEYKNATAEIGRLCGERQLAPYQDWYRAPGQGSGEGSSSQVNNAGDWRRSRRKHKEG